MKKNGFTLVEILAVFSIIAILGLLSVGGYTLISRNVSESLLQDKMQYALAAAEDWASETGLMVTNINHLISEGKLSSDDESGRYINPVTHEFLGCKVIRLTSEQGMYHARYTDEEACDYDSLANANSMIYLNQYDVLGNDISSSGETNGWTNDSVTLEIQLHEEWNYPDEVVEIRWITSDGEEVTLVNHDFYNKNKKVYQAQQLLNFPVFVQVSFQHDGKIVTYEATTTIRVDRQNPVIYDEDFSIAMEHEWTREEKKVGFTIGDINGSGVYGYAILKDSNDCTNASYVKTNRLSIFQTLPMGTYYLCVRDMVHNYSEEFSTHSFQVEKIDQSAPSILIESSEEWGKENLVSFDLTDLESGVAAYSFGNSTTPYEWMHVSPTSHYQFEKFYSENTTEYLYVQDAVGNISLQSFTVSHVDSTGPSILSYSLTSADSSKNGLSTILHLSAMDQNEPLSMCISSTAYEEGCTYVDYETSYAYTFSGTLDGSMKYLYVTIQDAFGNKSFVPVLSYQLANG